MSLLPTFKRFEEHLAANTRRTLSEIRSHRPSRAPCLLDVLELLEEYPNHLHFIAVSDLRTKHLIANMVAAHRKVVAVKSSPSSSLLLCPAVEQESLGEALHGMNNGVFNTLIGPKNMLLTGWQTQQPNVILSCTDYLSEEEATQFAWRVRYVNLTTHDVHLGITLKPD